MTSCVGRVHSSGRDQAGRGVGIRSGDRRSTCGIVDSDAGFHEGHHDLVSLGAHGHRVCELAISSPSLH